MISASAQMSKAYGFIYVDRNDDSTGTLALPQNPSEFEGDCQQQRGQRSGSKLFTYAATLDSEPAEAGT